ncbi:MAG: glycosyltransferase family 2 protein, partial [Ignisphaera sp.]
MNKRLIVACIPAYNEEKSIAKVVLKSRKYVDKVIVCDDGSTDMTGEIAEALGAEVIRHHKNMGYGAALESLFRRALDIRADIVVTLDADGQHNPEDIPRIIEPILRGEADIVIGSRFLSSRSKMPAYRRIGVKIINSIFRAGAKKISDTQSGYRAYSIKALSLVRPIESGMGASVEILLKAEQNKLRIKEIPIRIYYKVEQPSKVNPVVHALDVILTTLKHKSIR